MAERTLDDIASNVMKSDTVSRLHAAQELQEYLLDTSNSLQCDNMDRLVDALASWVNSSNFKVRFPTLSLVVIRLASVWKWRTQRSVDVRYS